MGESNENSLFGPRWHEGFGTFVTKLKNNSSKLKWEGKKNKKTIDGFNYWKI